MPELSNRRPLSDADQLRREVAVQRGQKTVGQATDAVQQALMVSLAASISDQQTTLTALLTALSALQDSMAEVETILQNWIE